MRLNLIVLTLCLLGGSLLAPTQAAAEPPLLAQSDLGDTGQTLPWQLVNSTAGQYVVDLPGTPTKQTSTSSLLERDLQSG